MLTVNPLIALLDPDEPTTSDDFDTIWHAYAGPPGYGYAASVRTARRFPSFAATVLAVTGETIVRCNDCQTVVLESEAENYHGDPICRVCQEDYCSCDDCCATIHSDNTCYLEGLDRTVCESCVGNYYWCENCEYYSDGPCTECSEGCECCPAQPRFRFPANGAGTIGNDERMTLTLPKGIISEAGIEAIANAVYATLPTADTYNAAREAYYEADATYMEDPSGFHAARSALVRAEDALRKAKTTVDKAIKSIGDEWQGKRGNYPKRLSSALHKIGVKLAPETISEVGNLARQYSDDQSEFHIEFTRDLNQSAGYFYHEDSCWWQSYANSRCALKNWGGLAMRTFDQADSCHDDPSGRVFVFPLGDDFRPTQNAETAHAYMVFNAYGALGGYSSARIIAHLAGKTYRKVAFGLDIDNGYVNSSAGYLVCDAETIGTAPESFSFGGDTHRVAQ